MKIYRIDKGYRYIKRYQQIAGIFAKYGFAHFFDRIKFSKTLRLRGWLSARSKAAPSMAAAERLRHAFEELGPTFIKLGQLLSTRSFLLPVEFIETACPY